MRPFCKGLLMGAARGTWALALASIALSLLLSGCNVVVANVQGCGALVSATGDMGMMMKRPVNVEMMTADCPTPVFAPSYAPAVTPHPPVVTPTIIFPPKTGSEEGKVVKPDNVDRFLPQPRPRIIIPPQQ